MKGIQFFFKSPLFYFHGSCGKVCPTDSDFFCRTNFAAVAMEIKRGDLKKKLISFIKLHEISLEYSP
jgi:hypothetical protein